MNHRTAVLSLFVGIAIVSFCMIVVKPAVDSQVPSDVKISDHDRIEKLRVEVAELQKKLAALTQKYETHTHQLQNVGVAQLPSSLECNQTVVQWAPAGINRQSVDRVCRQPMAGDVTVLVPGKESIVTGPPCP